MASFSLYEANIYTMPEQRPEIQVTANVPSTARLAARYADSFMTVITGEEFTNRLYLAVKRYARKEGRDSDSIKQQCLFSYRMLTPMRRLDRTG
jgi:coenzyme F420-dependent glucose-6-phosphate dehydrogenase